jgi:hypothetical protein
LSTLLRLAELGAPNLVEQLKIDLNAIAGNIDNDRAYHVIRPSLEIVRATDAAWVSDWLANKIADGSLWHESWEKMIIAIPAGLKNDLLHRLESEDFKHAHIGNILSVLTASADASMVARVFAKLCDLRRIINNAPDQQHEFEWAVERQLEALLRDMPADISVAGISGSFSKPVDGIELSVISRVFSSVARQGPGPLENLGGELRAKFRAYLKSAIAFVLRQGDFSGEMKANVGSVLAAVGAPEDMKEMRTADR